MTNIEDFPPNTAAHRIVESVRLLTDGFRRQLLELGSRGSEVATRGAEVATDDLSQAMHQLEQALRAAATLLQRRDVRVAGRDIGSEDRALDHFLESLKELSKDLQSGGVCYDDPSYYRSEGRQSAGEDLDYAIENGKQALGRGRS